MSRKPSRRLGTTPSRWLSRSSGDTTGIFPTPSDPGGGRTRGGTPAGVRLIFDIFRWCRPMRAQPPAKIVEFLRNSKCRDCLIFAEVSKGAQQVSPRRSPEFYNKCASSPEGAKQGSRPFRAYRFEWIFPGALPRANLFRPFGAETHRSISVRFSPLSALRNRVVCRRRPWKSRFFVRA